MEKIQEKKSWSVSEIRELGVDVSEGIQCCQYACSIGWLDLNCECAENAGIRERLKEHLAKARKETALPQRIVSMADALAYVRYCYEAGHAVTIVDNYGRRAQLSLLGGPRDKDMGRPDELGLWGYYSDGMEDSETQWYPLEAGYRQAARYVYRARKRVNLELAEMSTW
ncbi:MAG: hypothetical protein PHG80_11945 [Methanoregulaceae archaeon]|nr:hypothetical protein [Methanoregulaceae archaeon]